MTKARAARARASTRWSAPVARWEGAALLVHVPLEPAGLNGRSGQLRSSWGARRRASKRVEELLAAALAQAERRPPLERARLRYLRSYYSRPMDPDNLSASLKPVLDALQRQGVLLSDDPTRLVLAAPEQAPRRGRGPFFQLRIEPCEP